MIKKLLTTTLLTLTLTATLIAPVFASTKTGWKYYYNGIMATDIVQVNNKFYYFNQDGIMQTGWIQYGDKYKIYADKDGTLTTGWRFIDNNWYYFNQSRIMQTGIYDVDGKDYYFAEDGRWIGER